MKILEVQRIWRLHISLQKERKKILKSYWHYQCIKEMENHVGHYPEQVARIMPEIRDGIIEKWLSYCSNENINEFQVWRLHLMRHKFTQFEVLCLKKTLQARRIIDTLRLSIKISSKGPKTFTAYGKQVNKIFPLLDP